MPHQTKRGRLIRQKARQPHPVLPRLHRESAAATFGARADDAALNVEPEEIVDNEPLASDVLGELECLREWEWVGAIIDLQTIAYYQ